MATKKWSAAQHKKFSKTMAAKKKANKTSIPLDMIPDRPARKAKIIKTVEAAWQATPPLRIDEHTTQQAKMDILFGLITLAHKVLR